MPCYSGWGLSGQDSRGHRDKDGTWKYNRDWLSADLQETWTERDTEGKKVEKNYRDDALQYRWSEPIFGDPGFTIKPEAAKTNRKWRRQH